MAYPREQSQAARSGQAAIAENMGTVRNHVLSENAESVKRIAFGFF